MTKRTRFVVHCPGGHIARFSEEWHARKFAIWLSKLNPKHWIELAAPDGLIGQYRGGETTAEFEQHHISAFFPDELRELRST